MHLCSSLVRALGRILAIAATIGTPLFAQGSGQSGGHKLNVRASWFGAYTDDALADSSRGGVGIGGDFTGVANIRRQNNGIFTGVNGGLDYGYSRQARTTFNFNARTSGYYYPELDVKALQHSVDASLSRPLGGRTNVYLLQSVRASDHYQLEQFPDVVSEDPNAVLRLGDEFTFVSRTTYSSLSSVNLSHKLTRRAALGLNAGVRYVLSPADDFDAMTQTAGTSFQYQLTRYGSLRAGYTYRGSTRYAGALEGQPPFESHDVNIGVDYNRAFSISGKRTSLTFGTGSSLVAMASEEQKGEQTASKSSLRPVLLGSVTLRRNLGRTWDAQAGYRRMVYFVEGFTQPILADGVGANVGGLIGGFASFAAMVSYTSGKVGAGRSANSAYGSEAASAQLGIPLFRYLTFSTQYFYVRQRIGDAVVLPEGFSRRLDRHSVRVGLTLQLPLIS